MRSVASHKKVMVRSKQNPVLLRDCALFSNHIAESLPTILCYLEQMTYKDVFLIIPFSKIILIPFAFIYF